MNIEQIIKEELELYLEGKVDDLVNKFPELKPALEAGIKNLQYLQWIQKRRGEEPVEDVIDVIKDFDNKKQRLAKKDIYAYITPGELRQALEDLGASKRSEKKRLKSQETTYLGTFGDWIVAMPHTVESSCQLGKGTTWCTAATETQNLFLSYVGRGDVDIILYYIMKKGVDSRQDVTAKLSVGFVDGEPVLEGQDGGVSVDADNRGLTPQRLKGILGNQYDPIMDTMVAHAGKAKGVHPARKQMAKIAKDPNLYQKYTKNLEGDERKDFAEIILDYKSLSPEVLKIMLPDLEDREPISKLARNPNTSPQILKILASYKDRYLKRVVAKNPSLPTEAFLKLANDDDKYVRVAVVQNPNTPPEALMKLANDPDGSVREAVAKNPNTPPEVLIKLADSPEKEIKFIVAKRSDTPPETLVKLANDGHPYVRRIVVKNPSTPPEILMKLANDGDKHVRRTVAENPNTPPEALVKLANDDEYSVRAGVAENPNTSPEALVKLANDGDLDVRAGVAENPNTPPEALTKLVNDDSRIVRLWVTRNPNTPPEVLMKLADGPDEDVGVRAGVAENPNTPPEALMKLANDGDRDVRAWVARNPRTPPEALTKLANDDKSSVRGWVAENPNVPPEALVRLANDPNNYVRQAVVENPNYKELNLQETNRKTKITKDNLDKIIKEELELYLEGKAEDLVNKFPELEPALEAGIKNPQYLQWIQKRRAGEPVEDVIDVVKAFDKQKQRLAKKDIYAYKTPGELRQALEDLGASKRSEKKRLKSQETTYLGTFGDWIVAMPHTVESSCQLGKGTTWCTAATEGENLFLDYVGIRDLILYYIMKKGVDSRQDVTAKLSVGFADGEPVLEGQDGGVSVDANNKGLTPERLKGILGNQYYPIMDAMEIHAEEIGIHPAKEKMVVVLEVARNPSTPPEVLMKLANDGDKHVRRTVAKNPNIPPEALIKLANDDDKHVREGVTRNPNIPPEVLMKLANDDDEYVRAEVAENPSTPPGALTKLVNDDSRIVRLWVTRNPNIPPEVLMKLANDDDKYVRTGVAQNPNTPQKILVKLANDPDEYVRAGVAENPNYKKLNLQETNRKTKMTKDSLDKIIKEEYNTLLKERKMINYHISNKIPFSSNTFRIGSDSYFRVIKEARRLYKLGKLTPLNEMDKELFENSELGEWAIFEGERIPLDFPMYNEAKKKKDPPIGKPMKNTGGGKKYKVYVRNPKTGKIKKVTYGDSKGGLKGNWNNAEARKSFAARHKCAEKKDRTKPGYWACRAHKDFGTNVPGRFW